MTPKLYHQVSVEDRLPPEMGFYDSHHGLLWFNGKYFMTEENKDPKYWFEQMKPKERHKCTCPEGKTGRQIDENNHQICDTCDGN